MFFSKLPLTRKIAHWPMNICNRKRIGRRNESFFNNKYFGQFYESEEGYVNASLENQTLTLLQIADWNIRPVNTLIRQGLYIYYVANLANQRTTDG